MVRINTNPPDPLFLTAENNGEVLRGFDYLPDIYKYALGKKDVLVYTVYKGRLIPLDPLIITMEGGKHDY